MVMISDWDEGPSHEGCVKLMLMLRGSWCMVSIPRQPFMFTAHKSIFMVCVLICCTYQSQTQIALEKAHSQVKSPASIENGKLQAFCTRMHKSLDQLRSICQCYNNKESTSHR